MTQMVFPEIAFALALPRGFSGLSWTPLFVSLPLRASTQIMLVLFGSAAGVGRGRTAAANDCGNEQTHRVPRTRMRFFMIIVVIVFGAEGLLRWRQMELGLGF